MLVPPFPLGKYIPTLILHSFTKFFKYFFAARAAAAPLDAVRAL